VTGPGSAGQAAGGRPAARRAAVAAVVCGAVFLDMLLYGIIIPIAPDYVRSLGLGTGLLGTIFASDAIGLFAASPVASALTGRLGARRVLLAGSVGIVASSAAWVEASSVGMLILARAVQGMAAAMTWTASLALIAGLYRSRGRGQALGWLMTAMAVGSVAGAPAGGLLAESAGYRAPFVLAGALAVVEAALFAWIVPRASNDSEPSRLLATVHALLARGSSRTSLIAILAASTGISAAEPLLPLFLHDDLHVPPGGIGVLFGLTMLVFAAISPLVTVLTSRIGPAGVIAGGLAAAMAILGVLALLPTVLAEGAALTAFGGCLAAVFTPALDLISSVSDELGASYGQAYALVNIVYSGGMLIGPLAAGLVAQRAGIPAACAATALASLLAVAASRLPWLAAVPLRRRKDRSHADGVTLPVGVTSRSVTGI
jgi:MFS transporter, DHA1 family, solute carrier family 18 (vesicular amine transporter), member 1/2